MSEFICFENLSLTELVSLNIMRMLKKVIHKSDILLCDGRTIKAEILTGSPGHSDYHKFPTQHPTTADLIIWNTAIRRMSSSFLVLTVKLQEYISMPHSSPLPLWLIDDLGTTLHHNMVQGNKLYHKVYLPSADTLACRNQSGQCFVLKLVFYGHSSRLWASVALSQEGKVFLHSSLPCFEPVQPVSGFENVIRGFANQLLWVLLDHDGDGSWILGGMLAQSLIIINDGSYMKEISPIISSAASMIYCTSAKV